MSIKVKNSQLSTETMGALNILLEQDINAVAAFRLTRIIKELSSIVDDKTKMERKIIDKWVQKDENGNFIIPKDENGNPIEGAINISDVESFTREMNDLMSIENEIPYDKLKFEELNLTTAKVKDLIKLDFLFE